MMKKFFAYFLSLISVFVFFSGCAERDALYDNLTELRSDVLMGEGEKFKVKAAYGFTTEPRLSDGSGGEKVYRLTFFLTEGAEEGAEYSVSFTLSSRPYKVKFSTDPLRGVPKAEAEIDRFEGKELTVQITNASYGESVTLKSEVPENALDSKGALAALKKGQPSLIKNFTDENGNFTADVTLRIIVRNQKAYWYVGISDKSGVKAFLLDGISGEALAIREVL